TLTATATKSDADGVTLTMSYRQTVGLTDRSSALSSSDLTDTFDLSVLGNGDHGDVITVEVTPNDGVVNGALVSDTATVQNTAPRSEERRVGKERRTTSQTQTAKTKGVTDVDSERLTYHYN